MVTESENLVTVLIAAMDGRSHTPHQALREWISLTSMRMDRHMLWAVQPLARVRGVPGPLQGRSSSEGPPCSPKIGITE